MTEIIDIVEPYITGPQGPGGTIESAAAVGLAPGAEPTVTLGGTPEQRTIEFGIPEGEPGTPATITSATAETLPPQSAATVTVGGTPSARTFTFGIPKGDPGSGSVNSVNGDLGPDIVLDAADVGAVGLTQYATTVERGIVELATPDEAVDGSDAERAVTPLALAAPLDGKQNVADPRIMAVLAAGRSIVVFAGSSTTSIGEYPIAFMSHLHSNWRNGHHVTLTEASGMTFGDGLHGINAGASGQGAATYLGNGRGAAISALDPSIVVHTVGSSDWRNGTPASAYKTNLEAAISSLTSSVPLLHIIVHAHERINAPGPGTWEEYGEAAREVAAAQPNRIFVDASNDMRKAGVGVGLDNRYGLLSGDGTHLTLHGHKVLGSVVAQRLGLDGSLGTGWVDVSSYLASGFGLHAQGHVKMKRSGSRISIDVHRVTGTFPAWGGTDFLKDIPEIFRQTADSGHAIGAAWASGSDGVVLARSNGSVGVYMRLASTEIRSRFTYEA